MSFTTFFFDKFCDENKFQELEIDTDSLYSALAEENLNDCIRPETLAEENVNDSIRPEKKR